MLREIRTSIKNLVHHRITFSREAINRKCLRQIHWFGHPSSKLIRMTSEAFFNTSSCFLTICRTTESYMEDLRGHIHNMISVRVSSMMPKRQFIFLSFYDKVM